MKTFQEQKAYFQSQWPALREALETGGAAAAAELIRTHGDPLERRILFIFSRQGMMGEDWEGKSFDASIKMAELGIAELLEQAETETQPENKARRIDGANIISYNLSADLADCWPGDEVPRDPEHFKRGLKAAEDCLRWREELNKPAGPKHMAWWAKGMHEISLGLGSDAVASFEKALSFGKEMAAADGHSVEIGPAGSFAPILSAGYLGLAKGMAGDVDGDTLYEQACGAFKSQLEDETKKDDAQFGIEQLETVKSRYRS